MKINISPPTQVIDILNKFEAAGFEIYIVGGVVRDALLNKPLYDWDFTTNATPEQILELFPDGFYDNKFGTVGIKPEVQSSKGSEAQSRPFEITTFRTEENYTDNRHPDKVAWGSHLQEDLLRRDFTINAMALKQIPNPKSQIPNFEIIDLHEGVNDIQNKLIRAVGNPNERFEEDALRMLRAVRIASQLGFSIEEITLKAIQMNADKIKHISAERIHDEILKMFASDYPADGYLLLHNSGLGQEILPEMETTFGVEQKSPGRHHIFDVGTHSIEALRHCQSIDPITKFATLIHDVGKAKTQRILNNGTITFYNHEMESAKIANKIADRLRFSNAEKDKFIKLVRWHQFTVDERQTDSAIRRFIRNVGLENVADMIALRVADRLGGGARATSWRLEEYKARIIEVQKQPFCVQDLKISGKDVMEIKKISPGPQVGKYLQTLFDLVEKGLVNDREILIEKLKLL